MPIKKAVIIILILFLIVICLFAFFYFNKSAGFNFGGQPAAKLTPEQKLQQKLDVITNAAAKNPGQASPEAVRENIVNTINQEVINRQAAETPEQRAARLKADEERRKTVDAINEQIKKTLK